MPKKQIDPRIIERFDDLKEIDKDTFEKLLQQKIDVGKQILGQHIGKCMPLVENYDTKASTDSYGFMELKNSLESIPAICTNFFQYYAMRNAVNNNGNDFRFFKEITTFDYDVYALLKSDVEEIQKQKNTSKRIEKNMDVI